MYVAINYLAGTNQITSVSDGGTDTFAYVGGEFANSQSVAFYDVAFEHGGTVTINVTISATEFGTCRAGQLTPGTAVGVVGVGNSIASGTSLSVTNLATNEPSLLLGLFGSTRLSGGWELSSPSGSWMTGADRLTGYKPGTNSEMFGYNDTVSGTVTFALSVADAVAISGIVVEFYVHGPPTYNGYVGYDGNSVIYPTQNALQTCLPAVSSSSLMRYWNPSQLEAPINNSIVLETSLATPVGSPGVNGETCGPWYGWDTTQGEFILNVPFDTVSSTNITGAGNSPPQVQDLLQMGAVNGAVSVTGFPSGAQTGIHAGYYEGLNTTPGTVSGKNGNYLPLVTDIDASLAVAALLAGPLGVPIATVAVMNEWAGILGAYNYTGSPVSDTSVTSSPGSNPTISLWALAQNGSYHGQSCNWHYFSTWSFAMCGSNVFSEASEIQSSFVDPANVSAGSMTISAKNQLWYDQIGVSNTPEVQTAGIEASTSLSYLVEPSVSIGGTVDLSYKGLPASNAEVLLQQTCTGAGGGVIDFEETTNAAGYWHFFANPSSLCTYTESASGTNPYQGGTLTSPTIGIPTTALVKGGNFSATTIPAVPILNLAGGLVSFTRTGLPNDWSWSVTLNGVEQGATVGDESAITFLEPNESSPGYLFTVTAITGESETPSSGHIQVNGQNVRQTITFAPSAYYTATFTESGLSGGTQWSVTFNGNTQDSTGTQIVFSGLSDGYYEWSAPAVGSYAPNPSGGSVTIDGANAGVSTTFTASTHGGGCVALGTPILTPTGYVPVQKLKVGEAVEEYNFTSQRLAQGTFRAGNTTNVTELVDINNGWLYVTPTEQPIYIENATFVGWLHDPQNLTTFDRILDPVTNTWVRVTSVQIIVDHTVVFDVVTSGANNFVANGFLLDIKIG